MEPKQMLEAVIEKACIGIPEKIALNEWTLYADVELIKSILKNGYVKAKLKEGKYDTSLSDLVEETMTRVKLKEMTPALLFNHDFAKAYFGEQRVVTGKEEYECIDCGKCEKCEAGHFDTRNIIGISWRVHLQQAVLSEDPLLYYYQHL